MGALDLELLSFSPIATEPGASFSCSFAVSITKMT